MRSSLVQGIVTCGIAWSVWAAEPLTVPEEGFPRLPPQTPQAALATFRLQHGFSIELVASEPLIASPVDVAYDADGRAYVVEMRGYPLPEKPDQPWPPPQSRVRLLFDDDNDGRYDRSVVFVEGLYWPTAVCCWKEGVFVADAPDIWYFRDTNGDGVADLRRRVFTGFRRDNVQALLNNLRWGLDGWIYGAASGNGGEVVRVPPAEESQPTVSREPVPAGSPAVSVARRDFRFHPETEAFEALSGGARFGHSFDDWGQRFLCNIRNPVQHVVLPLEYVRRNPGWTPPHPLHDVAESGETLPVYRISPIEPWREFRARRWVQERVNYPRSELVGAGFFTSSSGVTIYRGGAYPAEFYGNAFVADVASNVVHRQVLEPAGVTFRGRRGEDHCEFLASTDIWFRPVNFANAPDGTLHVIDMYREYIEHPWSIPDDIRAKLDLQSGIDYGRIWRIVPPQGLPATPPPRLSRLPSSELVPHLVSPHAWWRETAQRLLLERQDRSVTDQVRALLYSSPAAAPGRLLALWTLAGLNSLTFEDVQHAAQDPHPGLREHAVRLAEQHFSAHPAAEALVVAASRDDAPRVRFQAAFSLGRWPSSPTVVQALAELAVRDADDLWLRSAILSSTWDCSPELLDELARRQSLPLHAGSLALVEGLSRTAAARSDAAAESVVRVLPLWTNPAWQFASVAGWLEGLKGRRRDVAPLLRSEALSAVVAQARSVAVDDHTSVAQRLPAVSLLKLSPWPEVQPLIQHLLAPQQPRDIQQAAIQLLGQFTDPAAAQWMVAEYRRFSPSVRSAAIDALAARPAWQPQLLTAVHEGAIPASDVPPARRTQLLNHKDPQLQALARQFFSAAAPSPRQAALKQAQAALTLSPNPAAGEQVFRRECAACHRLGGYGEDVGPPLASVRHRSPEELLTHILDPNREVGPNYVDYVVTLTDGRVLNGLLAEESESTLTLLRPQGLRDIVRRNEIEELSSTGRSLMPEGLEQRLTVQELADVIAYLRQ